MPIPRTAPGAAYPMVVKGKIKSGNLFTREPDTIIHRLMPAVTVTIAASPDAVKVVFLWQKLSWH